MCALLWCTVMMNVGLFRLDLWLIWTLVVADLDSVLTVLQCTRKCFFGVGTAIQLCVNTDNNYFVLYL